MKLGIDRMLGALLIDKPSGPTSHDVVAFVRRTLKISRVGHTGTLDPLATGLLVILVGPATRMAQFLAADEKEYVADVRLGVSTPTYDAASLAEGTRHPIADIRRPTDAELEAVLARFRGSFLQAPPAFSAKKIASVPAYEKARKNQPVDLKPVPVTVRELHVLHPSDIGYRTSDLEHRTSDIEHRTSDTDPREASLIRLRVAAGAGFYVRSLAHDIGQALGCGAHLEALRRIRVGGFDVDRGLTLDRVEAEGTAALIPLNDLLGDMPAVTLTSEGTRRAAHGNPLGATYVAAEPQGGWHLSGKGASRLRLVDADGTLLAVAERRADGLLHPLVVLG